MNFIKNHMDQLLPDSLFLVSKANEKQTDEPI